MEENENLERTPEVGVNPEAGVKPEVEVKEEKKTFQPKKFNYKKYLPYAAIVLAVILLVVVLVAVLGGGPKKAVKKYVRGLDKFNASKFIDSIDFAGMSAWGDNMWSFDKNKFSEDDYNEFIEAYENFDDSNLKEIIKEKKDDLKDDFADIKNDYKKHKIKVEKFKDVKKLGKGLYVVDAKISIYQKPKDKDDKEVDESEVISFIVYKNKVISAGGLDFLF